MSPDLIARALGAAIVPLLIGFGAAYFWKRNRNLPRLPKTPLVIGSLVALLFAGSNYIQHSGQLTTASVDSVDVMRTEQPAAGATEADLTPRYVQEVSAALVDALKKEIPDFDASPSTAVIEKDGKRLGVIRLKMDNVTPWISVIGIAGEKLVRVTCSAKGISDVDVQSPECVKAMQADFGTSIDG